jgi:4,5-dihydroxyphthalate decarboxylase
MPNLKLTLACWDYDRTRPLIDGRVKPEGIDLDIEVLRPRQTFQRMLDSKEFEVSELSLASYTALKGRGDCPFVAVPVALSKMFRHSCIYVRTGAGIHTPQDLKGKRVGTSQWSSTVSSSCAACCSTITASSRRTCTGSWAGSTASSSRR